MVNSISNVPFGVGAMDKVSQEQLASPGYYTMSPQRGLQEMPYPVYKEKRSFLSFLGNIAVKAILIGGAAIGIRKGLMNEYKVLDKLPEGAKFGAKFKNTFAKYTDKLYDATVGKIITMIKKSKTEAPKTPEAETKALPQASTTQPAAPANPEPPVKKT